MTITILIATLYLTQHGFKAWLDRRVAERQRELDAANRREWLACLRLLSAQETERLRQLLRM